MSSAADTLELDCPACAGRVSARWDQVGEAVECPLCHQPFEVPLPKPAEAAVPAGRLFHFQCLRCGSVLEARSGQGGRSGKCPTCGAVFTVPEMDPRTGLAKADADPGDDGENPTPVHAYAAAGGMAPKLIRQADDTLIIECPRCLRRSAVTADNCPGCGLPFTMEGVSARAVTSTAERGQTAWLLSLTGLLFSFCAGIGAILGVIGIVYGIMVLKDPKTLRRGGALAAIVLGVIDCVISVFIWSQL